VNVLVASGEGGTAGLVAGIRVAGHKPKPQKFRWVFAQLDQ